MRDVYERASPRRVVSTFIGCTNEDINGLIRDKSGNRRFFQFMTKRVDVAAMEEIDASLSGVAWTRTPEPMVRARRRLQIVKEMQAEQRYKSPRRGPD